MDSKVLAAILSIDSYNRGYNAGIDFNSYDGNGNIISIPTQLASLSIISDSESLGTITVEGDVIRRDQNVSFYGIAYQASSGEIIISYRGTDDPTLANNADILNGWVIGAGNITDNQAELAFAFYNEVANNVYEGPNIDPHSSAVEISLTGHSLGGGWRVWWEPFITRMACCLTICLLMRL